MIPRILIISSVFYFVPCCLAQSRPGKETFEQIRIEKVDGEVVEKRNYSRVELNPGKIEVWMDGLSYPPGSKIAIGLKSTDVANKTPDNAILRLTFLFDNEKKGPTIERKLTAKAKNGVRAYSITVPRFDDDSKRFLYGAIGRYTLNIEVILGDEVIRFRDRYFHVKDLGDF